MVVSEELIMIEAFDRFSLRLVTLMPPDHYIKILTRSVAKYPGRGNYVI